MAVTLLDVDLLVALAWGDHVLHGPAQRWFEARPEGWATAPPTEAGFVRVSMNPHVSDRAVPFTAALDLLAALRDVPGHEHWADDVDLSAAALVRRAPVVGAKHTNHPRLYRVPHVTQRTCCALPANDSMSSYRSRCCPSPGATPFTD